MSEFEHFVARLDARAAEYAYGSADATRKLFDALKLSQNSCLHGLAYLR